MAEQAVQGFAPVQATVGTVVYVALAGQYQGAIVVADTVKPDAKATLAGLKASGIGQTVMLTGDNQATAQAVAAELGVDEVHANLLPADKLTLVRRLQQRRRGKVAFVGDGLNDTPVLAGSDLGIAMGGLGSDAAIEAADLVLMHDNPSAILQVRHIAQKTRRIAQENIAFALLIKLAFLACAAFGVVNLWEAVFADVGVTLIAVLNALRLLVGVKQPAEDPTGPARPQPQTVNQELA